MLYVRDGLDIYPTHTLSLFSVLPNPKRVPLVLVCFCLLAWVDVSLALPAHSSRVYFGS